MITDLFKNLKLGKSRESVLGGFSTNGLIDTYRELSRMGDTAGMANFTQNLPSQDLKNFFALVKNGKKDVSTLPAYVDDCTKSFGSFKDKLTGLGGKTVSVLKGLGVGLAKTALNFGVFMLADLAIGAVAKGIDNFVHRSEKLIEKGKEAKKTITGINDAYKKSSDSLKANSESYEELSKGIDKVTNRNISLSDEDYKELMGIQNSLAESFPELVSGWDIQGNAILNFGNSAQSAGDQLAELLKTQRELANIEIAKQLPDQYKGIAEQTKILKKEKDEYQQSADLLSTEHASFLDRLTSENENGGFTNAWIEATPGIYDKMINLWGDKAYITPEIKDGLEGYTVTLNTVLNEDDLKKAKEELTEVNKPDKIAEANLSNEISKNRKLAAITEKEIRATWNELVPSIATYLETSPAYTDLSDKLKSGILGIVPNTDWNKIATDYDGNIESFIKKEFILPIASETPQVQKAYEELFTINPDDYTVGDYQNKTDSLIQAITGNDVDAQNKLKIKLGLAFETTDDKGNVNGIKDSVEQQLETLSKELPAISLKDLKNINVSDMKIAYDLVINADKAFKTIDELNAAITESKNEQAYDDNFKQIKEDVSAFTSAYSKLNEAMSSQGTGKSLSLENFNTAELEDYRSALEYVNGSLQLNEEKVKALSKAKTEETLATIKAADAQTKADYRNNANRIQELLDIKRSLSEAEQQELTNLQTKQDNLYYQSQQYSLMAASIREATGAYQEWLNSQNAPEEGDMGTDVSNAVQAIKDVNDTESDSYMEVGTKKYKAAMEFVVPDNIPEEQVQSYVDNLGTYFKDKSGAEKFLEESINKGLMQYDPDTEKLKVVAGKTMKDFASQFNWTDETVQAMFGVLNDYGGEYDWGDEAFSNIDDALFQTEKHVSDTQSKIDKINNKKIKTSVDFIELEQLKQELQEALDLKQELSAEKVNTSIGLDEDILNTRTSLNGMQNKQNMGFTVDDSEIEAAQNKLNELIAQKNELGTPTKVEIQAAIEDTDSKISTLNGELEALNNKNYTLSVDVNEENAPARIAQIQEQLKTLEGNKVKMEVMAETAPAESAVQKVQDDEIEDKNFNVNAIDNASSSLQMIRAYLSTIQDKTITVTTMHNNQSGGASGLLPISGTHGVNGTFNGSAFANGNAGNPIGQRVLIGELGREIVVDPNTGKWRTYGDNGAEFAHIPKNAIVFNHLQSENLLERGFVTGRGTLKGGALASGNAFVGGGISYKPGSGITSGYVPNSSSSATNQNTSAVNANSQAQGENTEKTKESTSEIDNFATRLSWLERKAKNITDSITEYVSFAFKSAKLKAQSKLNDTRISANQRSYEGYLNKANSIELSEDWKQKVRDGDFSIDTIDTSTDDGKKLKENIDNYQKWYDKALDCKDAVAELRREQTKLFDELMNIPTEKAEKKIEKLNDKLDLLEANYNAASSGSSATIQKRIQLKEKLEPQKKTAKSKNKITRKAKKEFNAADDRMDDSAEAAIKAVNKSGLSRTKKNRLKKQINAGKKISTKGFSGKKLKAVEAYDQSVSKRSSAKKSYKSAKKVSDKANSKVARTEKELRNLNRNDAQASYIQQNAILDKEVTNQRSQYNTYKKADKEADKNVKSTKKTVKNKGNSLLKTKNKKIQKQEAAIKAGKTINTKGLKGDDLKKAKAYNEAVKKNNLALNAQTKAANNAAKAQAELASKMAEVANQQMENIKAFYEAKGTYLSSNTDKASKNRELKVAQGKAVTENDFTAEIAGKRNEKTNLTAQQKAMQDQFNSLVKSGKIKSGSEDWYKWQADIDGIGNAASDAEIEIQNLLDSQKNIKVTNMGYSLDRLKADADKSQDDISLKEKKGILATAEDYNKLKTNGMAQMANLKAQNLEYAAQQKGLDINSEKYQEIQSKIEANEAAIRAAQQNQEEWNHTIENLPIEKLQKELELLDAQKSNLESIINLKKAQSSDLSKDDYESQITKNKEEIEKQKAIKKAAEENAKKYAGDPDNEYFKKYTQEALDADTAINNLNKDNEELQDTMRNDIYFRDLERMLEVTEHLRNSLSTIASLITDEMMFDDDGKMTDFGITKLATSIKEYESYMDDIQTIQKKIATIEGLKGQEGYSEKEYLEDLKNAQEELNEAIKNGGNAREAIFSIMKSQSKAELDAIFKVIDARNKLLHKTEDYYNYDKNMKKSSKELQQLKAQAAALDGLTDAESRAQKARLDAQIKEKQDEIDDTVHEQTIKIQMDGLDELKTELQEDYDKYIKDLAQNLDKITDLINGATDIVTSSFGKVGETIKKMLESLGVAPENFDWSGLGGAAKGGIIEKKIHSNGDSLLASVNPGETILTQDFTKILPEALFTMKAFHSQFADMPTPKIPKIEPRGFNNLNPNVNMSFNIQSNNPQDTANAIKKEIPHISKLVIKEIAKDARKGGLL